MYNIFRLLIQFDVNDRVSSTKQMSYEYKPSPPFGTQYSSIGSFNLRPMPLPSTSSYVMPLIATKAPRISFSYNDPATPTFPAVIQPSLIVRQPIQDLKMPVEYFYPSHTQTLPLKKDILSTHEQYNHQQNNSMERGDQIVSDQEQNDRVHSINGIELKKSQTQHKRTISIQSEQGKNLKSSTESFQIFEGPTSLIHRLRDSTQNFRNDSQNYNKQIRTRSSLKTGETAQNTVSLEKTNTIDSKIRLGIENQQLSTKQIINQLNNISSIDHEEQQQTHLFIKGKYKLRMKKKQLPNFQWVHKFPQQH